MLLAADANVVPFSSFTARILRYICVWMEVSSMYMR